MLVTASVSIVELKAWSLPLFQVYTPLFDNISEKLRDFIPFSSNMVLKQAGCYYFSYC